MLPRHGRDSNSRMLLSFIVNINQHLLEDIKLKDIRKRVLGAL